MQHRVHAWPASFFLKFVWLRSHFDGRLCQTQPFSLQNSDKKQDLTQTMLTNLTAYHEDRHPGEQGLRIKYLDVKKTLQMGHCLISQWVCAKCVEVKHCKNCINFRAI